MFGAFLYMVQSPEHYENVCHVICKASKSVAGENGEDDNCQRKELMDKFL